MYYTCMYINVWAGTWNDETEASTYMYVQLFVRGHRLVFLAKRNVLLVVRP